MKRVFGALLTLCFSSLALADSSITAAPSTDISIAYLGQIFGTVGNVLHGVSGDMLGQMFYKLNQGIFVVAGLFIAYTTTTMVLRSAAEGSFMGPDKKSGWFAMLRIPLGLALLMPIPATGYETYQSIVMEAVIQGVNLADSTWSWALNYLQAGGVVYMPPAQAAKNAVSSAGSPPGSSNYTTQLSLMQNVLASATCMEISNVVLNQPQAGNQNNPNAYVNYTYQVLNNSQNNTYAILYPGLQNTPGKTITSPSAAGCGYVSWDLVVSGSTGVCTQANATNNPNTNAPMECSLAQAAVQQIVTDMTDIAKQYACNYASGGSSSSYCEQFANNPGADLSLNGSTAVVNGMVDYQNLLMPLGNMQATSAMSAYTKFIKQAQADGWIMAGRYYWDISLLNDQYSSLAGGAIAAAQSTGIPNVSDPSTRPDIKAANGAIFATATGVSCNPPPDPSTTPLVDLVQCAFNAYYGNQAANSASPQQAPSNMNEGGPGGFVTDVNTVFSSGLSSVVQLFQESSLNPIIFIHRLGANLLAFAGNVWLGLMTTVFVLYIASYWCSGQSPIGQAITGAVDWIKPILMLVIAGIFGIGLTLAYYVPLYPYIVFTFGTIGWFIAVIEAMVAAPLVCLGLTHPEGHDFLGQAQQALMLLLGVFLRPVLMIMGLISAMILSYVALLLLNTGYGGIITSLYGNPGDDVNGQTVWNAATTALNTQAGQYNASLGGKLIFSVVVLPTLLCIFTMLVYLIIQQCYSLIFVLPENILTWIGGPKTDSHAGQYAQQIQGAVEGLGKGMGEGARATMGSGSSSLKGGYGEQKEQAAQKGKSDETATSRHNELMGAIKGGGGGGGGGSGGGAAAAGGGGPPPVPPV